MYTCVAGAACKFDHPELVEAAPTQGLVALTARDKQGCSIGFIDLEVKGETEEAGSSQASKAYFHSAPSVSGFKHVGTGTVQSAGLELKRGDQLSDLRLKHGKKGDYVVVDGALVACARRAESVYAEYLDGLCDALGDAELRDGAQHALCHGRACAAVWKALAVFGSLVPKIVRVIELLVKQGGGGGTSKRTASSALQHLLLSGVTLPPASPLFGLLCRKGDEDNELRTRFVQAMCSAWPVTPQARRRCFVLLQALGQHHPALASALLSFDMMMKLLSVTLPGGDHISCYHWRELPLKLLPSETVIQSSGAAAQQGAVLSRVLRAGGDYESFDAYMRTYVGLLREDCFAAMSKGLLALRCGTLDERDMRVFTSVSVVAMSPPNVFGGAEGTILELHAQCDVSSRMIMFGSLLALSTDGSFTTDLVWATVAGADELPSQGSRQGPSLRVFAELGGQLNDESDAQLVSKLLRHSGQVMMVESPTFYRAYAPAITVLQGMQLADLPFSDQIIHGMQEDDTGQLLTSSLDASIIFDTAHDADSTTVELPCLKSLPMTEFVLALRQLSVSDAKQTVLQASNLALKTTLDSSQSAAILCAMTRQLTVIQGPPGTGKSFTIVRLLRLLESTSDESSSKGPVLVLTWGTSCSNANP